MRVSVKQEKDGCWYVIDENGERYAQCGRWSTKELAQDQARKFIHFHGGVGGSFESGDFNSESV